jgi:hypothetical protein
VGVFVLAMATSLVDFAVWSTANGHADS